MISNKEQISEDENVNNSEEFYSQKAIKCHHCKVDIGVLLELRDGIAGDEPSQIYLRVKSIKVMKIGEKKESVILKIGR